jgi:hypothetical protein
VDVLSISRKVTSESDDDFCSLVSGRIDRIEPWRLLQGLLRERSFNHEPEPHNIDATIFRSVRTRYSKRPDEVNAIDNPVPTLCPQMRDGRLPEAF